MAEEESNYFLPEQKNSYFFLYNNLDLISNKFKVHSQSNNFSNNLNPFSNFENTNFTNVNLSVVYARLNMCLYFFFNNFFYKLNFYLRAFYSNYFDKLQYSKNLSLSFFFIKKNSQISFVLKNFTLNFVNTIYTSVFFKCIQSNLSNSFVKTCQYFNNFSKKRFNRITFNFLSFFYYIKMLRNFYMNFSKSFFTFSYSPSKYIYLFFLKDILFYKKISISFRIKELKLYNKLGKKKTIKINDYTVPYSLKNSKFLSKKFYMLNIFDLKKNIFLFLTYNAFAKFDHSFYDCFLSKKIIAKKYSRPRTRINYSFNFTKKLKKSKLQKKKINLSTIRGPIYNNYHTKFINKFNFKRIINQYFYYKVKNNKIKYKSKFAYVRDKICNKKKIRKDFSNLIFNIYKKNKLINIFSLNQNILYKCLKLKYIHILSNLINVKMYPASVVQQLINFLVEPDIDILDYASESDGDDNSTEVTVYNSISNNTSVINFPISSIKFKDLLFSGVTSQTLLDHMYSFAGYYYRNFVDNAHYNITLNRINNIGLAQECFAFTHIIACLNTINNVHAFYKKNRNFEKTFNKNFIWSNDLFFLEQNNLFFVKNNKSECVRLLLNFRKNINMYLTFSNILKYKNNNIKNALRYFFFKLNSFKILNLNLKKKYL